MKPEALVFFSSLNQRTRYELMKLALSSDVTAGQAARRLRMKRRAFARRLLTGCDLSIDDMAKIIFVYTLTYRAEPIWNVIRREDVGLPPPPSPSP